MRGLRSTWNGYYVATPWLFTPTRGSPTMVSSGLVEVFFRLLSSIRILLFQWRKAGNLKITEVRRRVVEWHGDEGSLPAVPFKATRLGCR